MTEFKYSTHVYDLSFERKDIPINLEGNSINVIAVTHDCYVKVNEKWEDPINLMHVGNIRTNFNKLYLSNKVNVGGYIAIIIGGCDFQLTTKIVRPEHKPLELPPQNIPPHLQGWAIDRPQIVNIWDIENAVFRRSFNFSSQTTQLRGLSFNIDGRKMYITGRNSVTGLWVGKIFEYDLNEKWNISTATFRHSLNIGAQTTRPFGLCLNPTGNLIYCIDRDANRILKYTLSVPWDISTATLTATLSIPTTPAATNDILDININSNGHKMYLINTNDVLHEYNLNVPWDITTATHINSFDMTPHLMWATSLFLSPDGLKSYVTNSLLSKIIEFRIMEAWDITTSIYNKSFNFSEILTSPRGLVLSPDGKKLYIGSENTNNIYEFDL